MEGDSIVQFVGSCSSSGPLVIATECCMQGGEENGRRHSGDEEVQMKLAAEPVQLPRQPSLRPDSATQRGIGRPPVRDHNMLMHGVRTYSSAARHMYHLCLSMGRIFGCNGVPLHACTSSS